MHQSHKDLFSTLLNQLWRLISGPITMLLIPIFLSPEQQGYWFLFGSISALSVFADLGFSNIILQFSAHEFAFLQFTEKNVLTGDEIHLKRLGSFLRFTIKWLSTICVCVFPIIYVVGVFFFIRDGVLRIYILPWTIFSIGSLINFFNNSILSFIEGMNKITAVQKIRLRVAVLNTCIVAIVLVLNGNIYALSIAMLVSSSTIFASIFGTFKKILGQLLKVSKDFSNNWRKEILPLFGRYALSFASGYFIFQIYTPLMHYFHGPVMGGKVGITMALVMAVFSVSNIWLYTITPRMNMFVSTKNWSELDRLFKKRLFYGIGTYLVITAGLGLFMLMFGKFWIFPKVISRFLPAKSLVVLLICYFLQLIINAWALYLRGHKQEPYVIPSLLSAVWIAVSTFIAGRFFQPELFFIGFLSSYFWGLPVCGIIFFSCKRKWHAGI